jgi:hypothetical protein
MKIYTAFGIYLHDTASFQMGKNSGREKKEAYLYRQQHL